MPYLTRKLRPRIRYLGGPLRLWACGMFELGRDLGDRIGVGDTPRAAYRFFVASLPASQQRLFTFVEA